MTAATKYVVSIEHGGVSAASEAHARLQHACDQAASRWLGSARRGYKGGTTLHITLSNTYGPIVYATLQAGQRKVHVRLAQITEWAPVGAPVSTTVAKALANLAYGIRATR